mgnify:CR=1 FL=1
MLLYVLYVNMPYIAYIPYQYSKFKLSKTFMCHNVLIKFDKWLLSFRLLQDLDQPLTIVKGLKLSSVTHSRKMWAHRDEEAFLDSSR